MAYLTISALIAASFTFASGILPNASKNFSNPPSWHVTNNFPSASEVFAQAWGA